MLIKSDLRRAITQPRSTAETATIRALARAEMMTNTHTNGPLILAATRGDNVTADRDDQVGVRLPKKGKGSPYSITERRVPEPIPVLGSQQPAGDVSHKPGGRLPLLSARPAVTLRKP